MFLVTLYDHFVECKHFVGRFKPLQVWKYEHLHFLAFSKVTNLTRAVEKKLKSITYVKSCYFAAQRYIESIYTKFETPLEPLKLLFGSEYGHFSVFGGNLL